MSDPSREEIEKAVNGVLGELIFPVCRRDDERGLDVGEYIEFVEAVLRRIARGERVVKAATLARRLCQLFDSGGESQRTVRARYASAIFQLLHDENPQHEAEQAKCDADPVQYLKDAEDRALKGTSP